MQFGESGHFIYGAHLKTIHFLHGCVRVQVNGCADRVVNQTARRPADLTVYFVAWLRSFVVDIIIGWWGLLSYYHSCLTATYSVTLAFKQGCSCGRAEEISTRKATEEHRYFIVEILVHVQTFHVLHRYICTTVLLCPNSVCTGLVHTGWFCFMSPCFSLLRPLCCVSKA